MLETDKNVVQIKNWHQQLRKIVNSIIILLVIFAFIYILYFQVISNDQWKVFEETRQYFIPLANFFYPDETTDKIYLKTGLTLLGLSLPLILMYYILDIIKDVAIKIYFKVQDYGKAKKYKRYKEGELMQYEVIKYFSICISLDWDTNDDRSQEAKDKLSAGLYQKIKNALSQTKIKTDIGINKTIVIKCNDFNKFDTLFYLVLVILSKIKRHMEKDDEMEMIPTVTVDAYVEEESFENIENNHFKIMSFNFKNKAISNFLFVKKYKFLKLTKYAGYSMGDYADFENDGPAMELYAIFDNLNEKLETIK